MSTVWTLLITDDCAEDREIYREYLSSDPEQSYQILEAASAEVGLELYQKKCCDAILLDFSLPDMSGLEFLDELRHQGWDEPLPVIMLTGQGNESIAVQAIKRGAQDYLVKQHLQPDVLQVTVRNVIQQAHLQKPEPKSERVHTPNLPPVPIHQDLAQIALKIRDSLDLQHILQTAATEIHQLLKGDRTLIYHLAPDRDSAPSHLPISGSLQKCCELGSSRTAEPLQEFLTFLADQPASQSFVMKGDCSDNPYGKSLFDQGQAAVLTVHDRQKTPVPYLVAPIRLGSPSSSARCSNPSDSRDALTTHVLVDNLPDADKPSFWGLLVVDPGTNYRQWQTDEVEMLGQLAAHVAIAIQQTEQLTQALTVLETERQLNVLKTQFVATVSHAYRAPLASILAAASTLKQHGKQLDGKKYQRFLQLIEDKARQMTQLVEELVVLETFESGKAAFTPLPFEVLQFFSDVIEEQRHLLINRPNADSSVSHELIFKISGNTRNFRGDPHLLRQILTHLLTNAIRFSPLGGNVEVHLMGTETHLRFDVKDQGVGIDLTEQATLFQTFSRGSNVSALAGHGLGLAIVKMCVELHKGDITIHSQPGVGTTVTVTLPKH